MASFGVVDSLMVYGFVKRLTNRYTSWDAYKTGVIDASGEIVTKPEDRDSRQKRSFRKFDLLVLRLRKLLEKIPGGSSRLATFGAALYLLREGVDKNDEELLEALMESIENEEVLLLSEEVTNTVGSGAIAGVDNPPKRFAGRPVFDVDMGTVLNSRFGKKPRARYRRYLDEKDHAHIIDFCRRNPKEKVLLRDSNTGQMIPFRGM